MTIFTWPGRLLYVGPAVDTAAHAHYAHQVTVALTESVSFTLDSGRELHAGAVLIPAMCVHAQRAHGAIAASLYMDGSFATQAREPHNLAPVDLPPMPLDCAVEDARAFDAKLRAAARLGAPPRPMSARTRRIIEHLRGAHPQYPTLAALARENDVSVGRLTHQFSAELGIPYRAYVLWLRVQASLEGIALHGSLTQAAQHAGFSDAAHLSRTFRRMFGIAPSTALHGVRIVRVDER